MLRVLKIVPKIPQQLARPLADLLTVVALTRRRCSFGFATNFLLREIELALLDLHSDTISFHVLAASVTVRLSASKGYPRGRTAARTHKCWCDTLGRVSCPFCSALFLVKLATEIGKVMAALEIV